MRDTRERMIDFLAVARDVVHASLQLFKLSVDVCDFKANRTGVLRSFLPKCLKLITKGIELFFYGHVLDDVR